MKADSARTLFYALGANLAEAIPSYADGGTQGLLLWGGAVGILAFGLAEPDIAD